jgi:glycosyltransferase involved in cell wall biosynthesis
MQRCQAWLRKTAPDLVCVSNGSTSEEVEWMLACRVLGIPYVIVAHANGEQLWPIDEVASQLAVAYSGARACFFVSRCNLELLEEQIGERLPAARIVRNPVNVDYDAAPPWPMDGTLWRLACVARLEPAAKGQDILIRVLSQPKWRERPLRVTLYGAGVCERSIRNLCSSLASIEVAGHVSDVKAIWAKNHALVLASRLEGLPLALVEAMLCSRTAIVTDVAGNTEVIKQGVTGFVAKAPTASLVDDAMEEAWSRREEWREMGLRARNEIRKLIPNDPVKDFCEELRLVHKASRGKAGKAL